jgi:hypothetical protein
MIAIRSKAADTWDAVWEALMDFVVDLSHESRKCCISLFSWHADRKGGIEFCFLSAFFLCLLSAIHIISLFEHLHITVSWAR